KSCDDEPISRSSRRADRAGDLDRAADLAANSDNKSGDESARLRQRLHATARVHRFRGPDFLLVDGARGNHFAAKGPGCGASVSDVGISNGADCLHGTLRVAHGRSCFSRAGNLRNRNADRLHRRAGLFFVAQIRERFINPFRARAAKQFRYASKIKEATNGGWRGAVSETRKAFEVISPRRIEEHVQIDESQRTSTSSQDQAQKLADSKTETQIAYCAARWKKLYRLENAGALVCNCETQSESRTAPSNIHLSHSRFVQVPTRSIT